MKANAGSAPSATSGLFSRSNQDGPRGLRLPRLFTDGMILQRDREIRIRGSAGPGSKVEVSIQNRSFRAESTAVTGRDGKWDLILPPLREPGPFELLVRTREESRSIRDILAGDVWVCSGQSNMQLPISRVKELYASEIANYANPFIRQFVVPEKYDYKDEHDELDAGSWEKVNPESIMRFSAVGFFFARELYETYGVPVGLVSASVGGAPAESFMSKEALRGFPAHLKTAAKLGRKRYLDRIVKRIRDEEAEWHAGVNARDAGLASGAEHWFDPGFDDSAWPLMRLPCFWDESGLDGVHGAVWFRREIDVPATMAGAKATLRLGTIVDSDTVYVNGIETGETGYRYPPRIYDVPGNLLVAGRNVIAIRVVNTLGRGGFVMGKPYRLEAGGRSIDLEGDWRYRVGARAASLPPLPMIQCQPLGLFNGMIAPLVRYRIRGVIWYQGESNVGRAVEYGRLFPALVTDWRKRWGEANLPFLYVQLANFMEAKPAPSESDWAGLREAQRMALALPGTGMAVAIDAGEWNDLHPSNKKVVGERLALAARRVAYGDAGVVSSGPLCESAGKNGFEIALSFSDAGSGLIAKGGGLAHFAVAGADRKFVRANARIEGDIVIVSSELVHDPVYVRYAWADNPEGANLYNREGLPASPFEARVDAYDPVRDEAVHERDVS
jgi:sialate O-acetylesterase